MIDDKLKEACGVFGVYNNEEAARLTYLGLYALQHRGQESSGISVSDGGKLSVYKRMGLVNQVFCDESVFKKLKGRYSIGHNRYSTFGSSSNENAQPVLVNCKIGQIAGSHNGNITNAATLKKEMENDGSIFVSTTDTEVIMHLIAKSRHNCVEAMIGDSLSRIRGAYALLFLYNDELFGARDPHGLRPLLIGKKDDAFFLSSESCAFDLVGAEIVREVEPGEIVKINENGITSFKIPSFQNINKYSHCVFEFIYFSRPDSFTFGENVDKVRRKLGRQLAREYPVENADLVMGVPDSATTAALGFSEESGIHYDIGLIRNHYVGRTFIHPAQTGRDFRVKVKFNPVKGVLKDKRVVVVDDSVVRGTTMKKILRLIRSAGPKEIHLRISSPPIISPCFYGIDMPTKGELVASAKKVDEIRKYLGADTLGYLSVEGMLSVMPGKGENYCKACFDGRYPVEIIDNKENLL